MEVPTVKISKRQSCKNTLQTIKGEYSDSIQTIIANRIENLKSKKLLSPSLKDLNHPKELPELEIAADRIVKAIERKEIIGIETDHDCDGQTAHAVVYYNLIKFGVDKLNIRSYIGHRLKEGYGLSAQLTKRILADSPPASLIITADNGTSDEQNIAILKSHDIDVIVTDHHQLPSTGIPSSAFACINPSREDSTYPDRYIAGCMVAWLLMTTVRSKLIDAGLLSPTFPKLLDTLDFVAVGTMADCVSLANSVNNRIVVKYGLELIKQKNRVCWQVLSNVRPILTSEDLAFTVGPLLNSDGRLENAMSSLDFLLSEEHELACSIYQQLSITNVERKQIQQSITESAVSVANDIYNGDLFSIVIFLENGHTGVHGISATKIKDKYGLPTILLAPSNDSVEILNGSARGVDGLDLKSCLDQVMSISPILIKYGGHTGAAGLSIYRKDLAEFTKIFEQVVKKKLKIQPKPELLYDLELPLSKINISFIRELYTLGPYGKDFESPNFLFKVRLEELRFSSCNKHIFLIMSEGQTRHKFTYFNAPSNELYIGATYQVIAKTSISTFNHKEYINLFVEHMHQVKTN